MAEVLAAAIPAIIRVFPWPKSMRWGTASLSTESQRWVRPLQGIAALLGNAVVPCEAAGLASGRTTMGHRFHSTGPIEIESVATYLDQLRAAHVIVDQDERAGLIRDGAAALAAQAGLEVIEDEGLVAENAGLTEWPVPLLGRFDEAFLSVPPEVIQLTARVNQKYFVCRNAAGKLANAFICTANIEASDGGDKIVEGNRKVLAARLSDAKFFYETDLKVSLEEQATKLDRIVFHEKLGTVADKVERVAKLARWLVQEGIVSSPSLLRGEGRGEGGEGEARAPTTSVGHPHPTLSLEGEGSSQEELAGLVDRAARLCKADLVTGMVGEFPELQGLMGGYYAAAQGAAQGEDPRVVAAIRDHYKPVGPGDDVPTDPVTVAVSLADKLDTLFGFFALEQYPTGSKDPFALRRAAIGICNLLVANRLRLPLTRLMRIAMYDLVLSVSQFLATSDSYETVERANHFAGKAAELTLVASRADLKVYLGELHAALFDGSAAVQWFEAVQAFLADRLKVQQREAGVRYDLIDAVFALGGEDDLVRLLARVRALQAFMATDDGANLLAGYKRAANILKKETGGNISRHAASALLLIDEETKEPVQIGKDRHDPDSAEIGLIAALDAAEPRAAAAVAAEDFTGAMAALASLRGPIDAFFEGVLVNDPDPAVRSARLALLARFRDAVHRVADFSKIEG